MLLRTLGALGPLGPLRSLGAKQTYQGQNLKCSLPEQRFSKSILVPQDQVDLVSGQGRGDVAGKVGQHPGNRLHRRQWN